MSEGFELPSLKRSRDKDGLGKSKWSCDKHWLMQKAIGGQLGVASMRFGSLAIVDMHAHDGSDATHPQLTMFGGPEGTCSARLAFDAAKRHCAKLFLCESKPDRMARLQDRFGESPTYLRSFNLLRKVDWTAFDYVLVLNDPNGHSGHGVETMQHIASAPGVASDFVVMVNEGSLRRHLAVSNVVQMNESARVRASRLAAPLYAWMLEADEWRRKLRKKNVATSKHLTRGSAYQGRMHVIANFLSSPTTKEFFK
jgi:hypothetical protein